MNDTVLNVLTVVSDGLVLLMAASKVRRVRRVLRSGQRVPTLLRVQAIVMGCAVVLMITLNGLSIIGS